MTERIDSLIISRRASGVITPNRILRLDTTKDSLVLQASSPKDVLVGVSYFMGRTYRRYQYQPQSSFVPSLTPGDISVQGNAPPDAIAGDMVDLVSSGIAPVEFGATVTIGQWLTSDSQGRAIPAYNGANAIGVSTTSGSAGFLGSILVIPTASYFNSSIPEQLTDAATISIDAALASSFSVTLAGNRTLTAPTNAVNGAEIRIFVKQDATGGRTLALQSGAGGFSLGTDIANTTLSTAANATDIIEVVYSSLVGKWLVTNFKKGYS